MDVILTNKPKSCVHTQNFNTGISDCHHLIGTFIKANLPPTKRSTTLCRSYKNFQIESFLEDLNNIDLPGAGIDSTTVNENFNNFENAFVQIADKHAPWKKRQVRKNYVPYMNSELRKAIYMKQMLRNKFEKCKSDKNWERYRKQRNLVTKLKKKSVKSYFLERCVGGQKSTDFWPTIKPFLSKKM